MKKIAAAMPVDFDMKFDEPVAESKYLLRVKAKELRFLNFYNFSGFLPIFPAESLKGLDGARYLKEYNFKMLPGSGGYILRDEDVVKGKSVSIRRRFRWHWSLN